jgi:hypothetical protein
MATMSAPPPESSVLNFVIRMVVPMRREFGRSLDVQLFMRDADYARSVLDQALASRDQRLRDYAEYVSRHLGGAREVDPPRVDPQRVDITTPMALDPLGPPAGAAKPAPTAAAPAEPTEAELRARMLKKYTSGLR